MKEEKILIGQSDGLIFQLTIAEKLRRINNSTIPTLIALGLSGDVETVVDIAVDGFDKLKEVYAERYYAAHPEAASSEVLRDFAENDMRAKLDFACDKYKFSGLFSDEKDGAGSLKKLCRFNSLGLLELDTDKFRESQKIYATGDNARLFREIEKAVKNLNEACRGYLTSNVFHHLFYFGEDKQLRIKDNIDLRMLDEIRGVNRGRYF